ncbi:uncharacterized protein N7469_000959 [Penicillium citrinum]|uniref:Uncharacterized protein n=1 Tax=Penicillium citrinum TaxID=5077 RepID=A0A9W9TV61_PENCI|nr:uncharacterized protein N7469_000959 [Penicillium citrinum]KAJ5242632.1 hypothetical protein N7469_000959 [Penicillium citrinum]
MDRPSKSEVQTRDVSTTLNYTRIPSCEGLQPIDLDHSQTENRNVQREGITDVRDVVIKDIRGREHEFTLDVQGFQYVKHQVYGVTDWRDIAKVKQIVQPATETLIKKATGASEVFVYLTRTRFEGNDIGDKMTTPNSPSYGVHSDITLASCRSVLKDLLTEAQIERLMGHRFMVVNVWRPVKPIQRDPLAVCDW